MDLRATIVVLSSMVSIGGSISGCAGDDPAVSAETSTGPSDSGNEDPATSVAPESSGPSSATDPSGESSGMITSSTGTTTEGESSEGESTKGTADSTGDASSGGSSGGSTDTGGETGVLDGCDPVAQNCPDGQACYPFMAEFDCYGISEAGAQGDACAFVDVCDAGLFCASAEIVEGCMDDVGCCTAFCDLSNPVDACQDISPMMFCFPWYAEGDAPRGLESVGACLAL